MFDAVDGLLAAVGGEQPRRSGRVGAGDDGDAER